MRTRTTAWPILSAGKFWFGRQREIAIDSVAGLAQRCLRDGVAALSLEEQTELRNLFLKEARKGAFRPGAFRPEAVVGAFCTHVLKEFDPTTVLTVVDCLPYFRQKGMQHSSDQVPLASLILYAAWGEHWINVIITMGMLRAGKSESERMNVFTAQPPLDEKIALLRRLVKAEPPKKHFDCLIQTMKTRNEYLHYSWEGRPKGKVDLSFKGVVALIGRAEATLDGLLEWEHDEFDGPFMNVAATLFPAAR